MAMIGRKKVESPFNKHPTSMKVSVPVSCVMIKGGVEPRNNPRYENR